MYLSTYHRFQCKKCAAYNWVDADCTGVDPIGFTCWNCNAREILDDAFAYTDEELVRDFPEGERFDEVKVNT